MEGRVVQGVGCLTWLLVVLHKPSWSSSCCHQASSLTAVPPGRVELCLPRCMPNSYRDALLDGVVSIGSHVASDTVDLKQWRSLRGQQRKKHHGLTSSLPPILKFTAISDEGWQVVRPRQRRVLCHAPLASQRSHSPHYLIVVVGRCLNCLSFSHRRVDCRLPTHFFNCHSFHHHLWDCKHPQKSLALHVLNGSKACANVDALQEMHIYSTVITDEYSF
jgi:hypothetical protein